MATTQKKHKKHKYTTRNKMAKSTLSAGVDMGCLFIETLVTRETGIIVISGFDWVGGGFGAIPKTLRTIALRLISIAASRGIPAMVESPYCFCLGGGNPVTLATSGYTQCMLGAAPCSSVGPGVRRGILNSEWERCKLGVASRNLSGELTIIYGGRN